MRIVGNPNAGLNQRPATPEEAWQRGRVLDAMLPRLVPLRPGISRLTHAQRNAQDEAHMLATARLLNAPQLPDGAR
jgi:hypothetical protein